MHFYEIEGRCLKPFYLTPKLCHAVKGYTAAQLLRDVIAGVIVAVIALPLSIALALASGVEPAAGVYTAIFAGFIVSLLGGSRVQIAGPTAAFATIVAGVVATQGLDGLFYATVMAGILLILMGVFRLGSLIKFIPATITVGFTAGIAVTIFLGQVKDFLGLTYAAGVRPIETLEKIEANFAAIGSFSLPSFVIGAISLLILILYPRFEKRVPPSLIAVAVTLLLLQFVPWFSEGVFTIGELYTIPAGLPQPVLGSFAFDMQKLLSAIPSAFTIALLAAIESLLSCVVADGMVKSKHNSNAELVAQGLGNMASVLFGGIPATGAIARTAANVKNGGRTPIAGMVHALVLLLALLFLMPVAAMIPMPTIAAILFMVAFNMSEYKKFLHLCRTSPKSDILVLVLTFALTVIFDLVVAIAVGLILTLVLFLKRISESTSLSESEESTKEHRIYSINGPLFFGSKDILNGVLLYPDAESVTLLLDRVTAVDASALRAIDALSIECAGKGIVFRMEGAFGQAEKALRKYGLLSETTGTEGEA